MTVLPSSPFKLLEGMRPRHTILQSRRTGSCCKAKMYVPSDSFGGLSPERKAARAMQNLFTFAAVRIVLSQLEGSGRGDLASYNSRSYKDLHALLEEKPFGREPLTTAEDWLTELMHRNEMLAIRIMEVRAAYCQTDFEWEQFQRVANQEIQDSNVRLMRKHASEVFEKAFAREDTNDPKT